MRDNPEKEMEALSKAIVEAIMSSTNVKDALEKLQKLDVSTANSIMVFMVRLDSLANNNGKGKKIEPVIEESMKITPGKRTSRKKKERYFIVDGKILTKNEQKFLDYLSQKFDQPAWLRKNKIKLD